MSKVRTALLWAALLGIGPTAGLAQVADSTPDPRPEPIQAEPALLIVRVTEVPGTDHPTRRLAIVEPRGLRELPGRRSGQTVEYADDGTPQLGFGYDLVRTCQPQANQRNIRYFIYHADLSDSNLARRWRELQQAERAERRQARAEARNEHAWERRKHQLLDAHAEALDEGTAHLQAGKYRAAVISLTRAAELNQGDPVCRIHLAQARVALGHDSDAARVLRRALDLQPKLVPMVLGLERYYPHAGELAVQTDALAQRVAANSAASANEYFLLGFMEFQSGWLDEAHAAFRRAARERPKDALLQTYLDLTKPPGTGTGAGRAADAHQAPPSAGAPRP
jgi:tetratricopeptide (TPR) repeat protein